MFTKDQRDHAERQLRKPIYNDLLRANAKITRLTRERDELRFAAEAASHSAHAAECEARYGYPGPDCTCHVGKCRKALASADKETGR